MKQIILLFFASFFVFFASTLGDCDETTTEGPEIIGCLFNGVIYSDGEIILDVCIILQCSFQDPGYAWVFLGIDWNCAYAGVYDDPHFYMFNYYNYFDSHITCNYSLSQQLDWANFPYTDQYNPKYAIYGAFRYCDFGDGLSCVHITTYKADEFTAVKIDHANLAELIINGNTISLTFTPQVLSFHQQVYPIIAWIDYYSNGYSCIYILGPDFSICACTSSLFILTTPSHQLAVGGLFGFYTGTYCTDFLTRNFQTAPYDIESFVSSWMTTEQNPECNISGRKKREVGLPIEPTVESLCDVEAIRNLCNTTVLDTCAQTGLPTGTIQVQQAIENCVIDCCANELVCPTWLDNTIEIILTFARIADHLIEL